MRAVSSASASAADRQRGDAVALDAFGVGQVLVEIHRVTDAHVAAVDRSTGRPVYR